MESENPHKPLVIRDEIHGDMKFDYLIQNVIDHPYFQRLRNIKQLGLADFVFPCATHSRFQHCLGAAYLAGRYFDTLVKNWLQSSFRFDEACENTRFFVERTQNVVAKVEKHGPSRAYWSQIAELSGLLHDIGHGPWSHSFENLELKQDFSKAMKEIPGSVGETLREKSKLQFFSHEDISVIYIFHILKDLADRDIIPDAQMFFLPVASLVNKCLFDGKRADSIKKELENTLDQYQIAGGIDFHKLLRPLISGPFDVDRMDYIQRDAKNSGVSIGSIEWRRIVGKLFPCLAQHESKGEEDKDVVLLSSVKNQHVLDHFIFSLFQMYTQVYLHPKVVGLEKVLLDKLEKCKVLKEKFVVDFEKHTNLSDEKLFRIFVEDYGLKEVRDIFLRKPEVRFEVATNPPDVEVDRVLEQKGFHRIEGLDRPMMKDTIGVFLYTGIRGTPSHKKSYFIKSWRKTSPIAEKFSGVNYSPRFWLRSV